jgi:hypothetical protein
MCLRKTKLENTVDVICPDGNPFWCSENSLKTPHFALFDGLYKILYEGNNKTEKFLIICENIFARIPKTIAMM